MIGTWWANSHPDCMNRLRKPHSHLVEGWFLAGYMLVNEWARLSSRVCLLWLKVHLSLVFESELRQKWRYGALKKSQVKNAWVTFLVLIILQYRKRAPTHERAPTPYLGTISCIGSKFIRKVLVKWRQNVACKLFLACNFTSYTCSKLWRNCCTERFHMSKKVEACTLVIVMSHSACS